MARNVSLASQLRPERVVNCAGCPHTLALFTEGPCYRVARCATSELQGL